MQNGPLPFVRPRPGFLQLSPAIDDLLVLLLLLLLLLLMLFDSAKVRTAHKKSEACFNAFADFSRFFLYTFCNADNNGQQWVPVSLYYLR